MKRKTHHRPKKRSKVTFITPFTRAVTAYNSKKEVNAAAKTLREWLKARKLSKGSVVLVT